MAAKSPKPASKSEVIAELADSTGLSKKQIKDVFDALVKQIEKHLGKKGSGAYVIPNLVKIRVAHKPATKPRKMINMRTGEEMMTKAKPACNVIKVRALKTLKGMA